MQTQLKEQIRKAAQDYMTANQMTATNLHKLSGVSEAYLSSILAGKWVVGTTEIADRYFLLLARAVGYNTEKVYWKQVMTKQMRQIITELEVARENGRMATVICPTGMGKTYCVNMFKYMYTKDVFVVTINSLVKLHDVVNKLLEVLGLPQKGSKAVRLMAIILKVREMKMAGLMPTLIFDEAENMEQPVMRMMKGLYDGLVHHASIVQIGTKQLETKMERAKNSHMEGGPQYFRRCKMSIRQINTVVNFDPFFKELGVTDAKVQRLALRECENYGELHDLLEPALREADLNEVPVTVDLIRTIHSNLMAA